MKKRINTTKIGNQAEDIVINYAKGNGWKILTRNFSKPWGEIDIVAKDKKIIIFIEVKALDKKFASSFKPENHFTPKKIQKVIRTVHSYLSENNYPQNIDYRIDLAALELDFETGIAHLRYYKNANA